MMALTGSNGFRSAVAAAMILVVAAPGAFAVCGPGEVEAQPGVCIVDGAAVPKYVNRMVIPPVMPRAGLVFDKKAKKLADYYEIEVTQFDQQILPAGYPTTTVWSYSAVGRPQTRFYPAFTIEAWKDRPVRVKWINNLKDPATGMFLPHLIPVDQTLHWANPPQECRMDPENPRTDCEGTSQDPYGGPVPLITHVHGAHVGPESDGYPEAWFLPAAGGIPSTFATEGSNYRDYLDPRPLVGGSGRGQGFAVFQYPNDQPPTTLWYHDHTLGMTRANVYAGPAGFYLIRDAREALLNLPGPPPLPGSALIPQLNPNNPNIPRFLAPHEIPIVIQDRSFKPNGQLFYPDNRDLFEVDANGDPLAPGTLFGLGIRFAPRNDSDVAPIWNPEAFFNTMVVNGQTWPYLDVEPRKYRFRFLNGCNSRFLILRMMDVAAGGDPSDPANWLLPSNPTPFKQIGAEQGYLQAPVLLSELLMGLAERADVIVDFSGYSPGDKIILINVGPDEPFGGGSPGVAFDPADPASTGQVMVFSVVPPRLKDLSNSPATLPNVVSPIVAPDRVRQVSLNEAESANQQICVDGDGNYILINGTANRPNACAAAGGSLAPFGPTMALLGTGAGPLRWADAITETPGVGDTETWEIFNNTVDAHPIHIHLVSFRVIDREIFNENSPNYDGTNIGAVRPPEVWESGGKDTVIAFPGEITRVQATFDIEGIYVWHCHIVEHEDNEMMRPYCVGDPANCDI